MRNLTVSPSIQPHFSELALSKLMPSGTTRTQLNSIGSRGIAGSETLTSKSDVRCVPVEQPASKKKTRPHILLHDSSETLSMALLTHLRNEAEWNLEEAHGPVRASDRGHYRVVLEAGQIEERFEKRGFCRLVQNVNSTSSTKRIILTTLPVNDLRVLAWEQQADVAAVFPVTVSPRILSAAIKAVVRGDWERAGLWAVEAFQNTAS